MTGTPPRPPPPPRYEARNTDGSAGSRHLSRLDAVLPAVVTIRLRGGGLPSAQGNRPSGDTEPGHTTSPDRPPPSLGGVPLSSLSAATDEKPEKATVQPTCPQH